MRQGSWGEAAGAEGLAYRGCLLPLQFYPHSGPLRGSTRLTLCGSNFYLHPGGLVPEGTHQVTVGQSSCRLLPKDSSDPRYQVPCPSSPQGATQRPLPLSPSLGLWGREVKAARVPWRHGAGKAGPPPGPPALEPAVGMQPGLCDLWLTLSSRGSSPVSWKGFIEELACELQPPGTQAAGPANVSLTVTNMPRGKVFRVDGTSVLPGFSFMVRRLVLSVPLAAGQGRPWSGGSPAQAKPPPCPLRSRC